MAALPSNCPLNSNTYKLRDSSPPVGSDHLLAIEHHVSSNDGVDCHHPLLKEFIFGGRLEGSTPLLLACHFGNFDSVKRIVQSWGADVRTAASYYPKLTPPIMGVMMKIDRATPLFIAAFQGHIEIVRYLLGKGADVAAKTSDETKPQWDGLTPLYGAIYRPWILPNRWFPQNDDTVLITELLLAKGSDPNDLDVKALDFYGLTPLNVAAIGYPFNDGSQSGPNEPVLRNFVKRADANLLDKIDALELAGAMTIRRVLSKSPTFSVFLKTFNLMPNSAFLGKRVKEFLSRSALS